jgi:RNA polymerase sigma factor (sigma-70 family)
MNDDAALLRRFAEAGDQDAFTELVRRKVNLVYSAALRQVGGDAHLAQEVTQGVFVALASRAAALSRHPLLAGWLYTTTHFIAAKAVRTTSRWRQREQEATMRNAPRTDQETDWNELRPVIDDVMHELGAKDRAAILLRFFEGKSIAEVGAAIGLAENAARMRIDRALEKARVRLEKRGITSTATALGAALVRQPATAAPAAVTSAAAAIAGAAALGTGNGSFGLAASLLEFMSTTKIAIATLGAIAGLGVGLFWGGHAKHENRPSSTLAPRLPDAAPPGPGQVSREPMPIAGPAVSAAAATAASQAAGDVRTIERLRALADAAARKLVYVGHTPLSQDHRLQPEFVELFGLTEGEQQQVQRTIDEARAELAVLERENATITREADGRVVIALAISRNRRESL